VERHREQLVAAALQTREEELRGRMQEVDREVERELAALESAYSANVRKVVASQDRSFSPLD
jgi:hypothetical protein